MISIRIGHNKATNKYYFVAWNDEMNCGCRLPSKIKDWDAAKEQARYYQEFFSAKNIEYHLG